MDITLALGGGGMRGAAHLGVLRVLEKQDYRIRALAGTSIGSLVGAFYACGYSPAEIETLFAEVNLSRSYGWPLAEGPSLLGARGIADFLCAHLGDCTFADLKLPFAAVAVDLNSRRAVFLREGPVVAALLGSMAIPGFFPPQARQDSKLVDGGALDPVPVRAARALSPGLPVVAVSLCSPLDRSSAALSLPMPQPLANQLGQLNITQAAGILAESIDLSLRELAELRLRLDQPEVLIQPEVEQIGILDQVDVRRVAFLGERAAYENLPQLQRAQAWPLRFWRWLAAAPAAW